MSSERTARRLNRILAMLPWVIANPGADVDEVCERFGYTRAQLVADLNTVFVCGLPGYGPGELMVAYIDDEEVVVEMADYFGRPLRLSPTETLGLIASGRALLSSGQGSPVLERAVEKLERSLFPDGGEAFHVDLAQPPLVGVLRDAAVAGDVTRIDHTSIATGEAKVRDIEPHRVFSTLGSWYVAAFCRDAGAERVFRIDRIRTAEPTGEQFPPHEGEIEPEVRYTPNDSDVQATIHLGPRAQWVSEYYPLEVVEAGPEGSTVRFSASDPAVAARLLIRLGGDADLVEGDEVAAATADLRTRILARYRAE